jgi:hypothetical protein
MKRIDLLVDDTLYSQLKSLGGTLSTHIRIALYEYLQKLSKTNVSSSRSKRKEEYGSTRRRNLNTKETKQSYDHELW